MPDPRYLIINADDLGLSRAINAGIMEGLDAGVITDTSLMPAAPFAREAAQALRSRGRVAAGIHLDLDALLGWSSPGKELYPRRVLPEMMQRKGFPEGLRAEGRRQIEAFLALGLAPSHIDAHHHVHGFEAIFTVLLDLMKEYHIPCMRFSPDGYRLPSREDIPWSPATARWMKAELDRAHIAVCACMLEGAERIGEAGAGVTELVVHPGKGGDAWREREMAMLLSAVFRRACTGFALIDFRSLCQAG